MHENLHPKQKNPSNFFRWHTICGSPAVTDQISFNHKFGKPGLNPMRRVRNGCYSSSNNLNGIWKQLRSIQNGNAIIL